MWLSKQEYRELIERAAGSEARIEALTIQCNALARENAELKMEKTGKPQTLPIFAFQKEGSVKRPSDLETGVSFDDMGDEAAHQAGFTEA